MASSGRPDADPDTDGRVVPIGLSIPTYKRAAYERLRDMIIELELPPGARLVEGELADLLHVSKTPVREAISLLEGDGLVDIAPYRGASVTWLSVPEMRELKLLIDALELPLLPRLAERITPDEEAATLRVLEQLRAARAERDGRRFRELTVEYHRLILEPSGYRRVAKSILTLVFPVGLRYDRVFYHNFDDSWDLQVELMAARISGVISRDTAAAAAVIASIREQLLALNMSRLSHPLVAPYLEPTPAQRVDGPASQRRGRRRPPADQGSLGE